jgi:hypothetical protein
MRFQKRLQLLLAPPFMRPSFFIDHVTPNYRMNFQPSLHRLEFYVEFLGNRTYRPVTT